MLANKLYIRKYCNISEVPKERASFRRVALSIRTHLNVISWYRSRCVEGLRAHAVCNLLNYFIISSHSISIRDRAWNRVCRHVVDFSLERSDKTGLRGVTILANLWCCEVMFEYHLGKYHPSINGVLNRRPRDASELSSVREKNVSNFIIPVSFPRDCRRWSASGVNPSVVYPARSLQVRCLTKRICS